MKRDFLHINGLNQDQIYEIFDKAEWIKSKFKSRENYRPFDGMTMAMIFAKPSARTRVSFETGFYRLGGHVLEQGNLQSIYFKLIPVLGNSQYRISPPH